MLGYGVMVCDVIVRSWSGGENSIEAGVGGKRVEVRDAWDQDLDRGKVSVQLAS